MTRYKRFAVLAEGLFSPLGSKTANQVIRYLPERVAGIIDSTRAKKTAADVLGYGGNIPVFGTLRELIPSGPDALLIGVAPAGGRLPEDWRPVVREAIINRLDIVSGLHTFLSDDPEFRSLAEKHPVTITDLRKVPSEYEVVAGGLWKNRSAKTILTVGTDCNTGKMTASLELHREFLRRGLKSDFVATGQTGILIDGRGIAVDSLVADYLSGAIEREIEKRNPDVGFFHVEGQGALTHQGYSAVTLGLMHGVMPDAMILVHHAGREKDAYGLPLDDIRGFIRLHEEVLAPFKSSRVVGCAMNTVQMSPGQIREAREGITRQTGLPVADVLNGEAGILADALIGYFREGGRGNKTEDAHRRRESEE